MNTRAVWRKEMERIMGEWNGDDPGVLEERAGTAEEVLTLVNSDSSVHRLAELFDYLAETHGLESDLSITNNSMEEDKVEETPEELATDEVKPEEETPAV